MTPTGAERSVQPEDAKYIKRRVKSGTIDVHPTETALIVNYEVEASILGVSENTVLSDKKDCQKIIRLKSLNKNSDCSALAREVVNKCSLIHPSKTREVEHLIYFLQSRKEDAFTVGDNTPPLSNSGSFESQNSNTMGEKANFASLEEYVELLYEDLPEKVKGSCLIMQLSKEHDNLDELARSDAVLSALSRVLREDYKKSVDLSFNIVSIFNSFSQFSQFHPLILKYKIGSLCIGILEFELQRFVQWKAELVTHREGRREIPASRLPLPRRSSTPSPAPTGDKPRLSLLPVPKTTVSPKNDEETSQKKFNTMVAKQDKLLRVNFSILLNIAENLKVEDKIRRKNIVAMLVTCLERSTIHLLIVVAKFLAKLSVRIENKDEMTNLNVIEKLPKLLQMNNYELEKATLNLLFNLSFDAKLRDKMVKVGFLPKLVSLLNDERHTKIVLRILYHLSLDDRVKPMFTFTDCLPQLMKMLVGKSVRTEEYSLLVALCINEAVNSKCAEVMCDNSKLEHLINSSLTYQDVLLMKLIRNLAFHESTRNVFLAFADDLIAMCVRCDNVDFLLECVGTLANLPLEKINISDIFERHKFLRWVQSALTVGKYEDDIVLEIIMLVGAAASDEACAVLFCKSDIVVSLIEMLKSKQEDDEIVLQIIYVFYKLSKHTETRKYLTTETEAAAYLIELMNDNNAQIRKVCDSCVEVIKEEDQEYEERVKAEKFRSHNSHWIGMVENKALEASLASLPEDPLPHYTLLNQSLMMQTGSHISLTNNEDIEIVSNHPTSEEGSRPISRYDSEPEDFTDPIQISKKLGVASSEDVSRNALRNLVIEDDSLSAGDSHRYFHIDTPTQQMAYPSS